MSFRTPVRQDRCNRRHCRDEGWETGGDRHQIPAWARRAGTDTRSPWKAGDLLSVPTLTGSAISPRPHLRARRPLLAPLAAAVAAVAFAASQDQRRTDAFVESREHPAIAYSTTPSSDPVAGLNEQLERGAIRLTRDKETGYLKSVLEFLKVPVESQLLVFSETSAQASRIRPNNPRAVYFNDSVSVGWVRGGGFLELSAHDPLQGVVFYTLDQRSEAAPRFRRDNTCLQCHLTWDTLGVPGMQMLSTFQMPDEPDAFASGLSTDHRFPFNQRWGGWYVTGRAPQVHRGNVPVIVKREELRDPDAAAPRLNSVGGLFDTSGYLSEQSDVVALMVLEHQGRMINLITRLGWEARVAYQQAPASAPIAPEPEDQLPPRVRIAVQELVDYLLFIDEELLPAPVQGSSGFAAWFSAQGPFDSKGRSLRSLDLKQRLFRHPCSFMIYTPAFDRLPPPARDAVYRRMWRILSGEETGERYAQLSAADRQAVIEILSDTKQDLPDYFRK